MLLRLIEHRPRLGKRGVRGGELDFEPGRVDTVKDVARLHLGALLEQALHHNPRDARANLGDAHWRDAAWQLPDNRPRGGLHRDKGDLGRCFRLIRLSLGYFASGKDDHPTTESGKRDRAGLKIHPVLFSNRSSSPMRMGAAGK